MTSLSVGVKSTGILVNSLSKLQVSRRFLCKMGGVVGGVRDVEVEGGKWNGMEWKVRRRREDFFVTSLNVIAQLFKEAHSSSFGRRFKIRDLIMDYLQFPYQGF